MQFIRLQPLVYDIFNFDLSAASELVGTHGNSTKNRVQTY